MLNNALNTARFARLVEQDAMEPGSSYAPADFLADVRRGVWKELEGASPVKLDAYRRNLQRAYLEIFNDRINRPATAPSMPGIPGFTPPPTTEDVRPFFRSELRALNASVAAAISRTADRATRAHLEDVKDQIAKILDPKFALPTAQPATGTAGRGLEPDGTPAPTCWPDYKIIR